MVRRMLAVLSLSAIALLPSALTAQQPSELVRAINRSGPRFGVTWLGGSITDTLKSKYKIDVAPVIAYLAHLAHLPFSRADSTDPRAAAAMPRTARAMAPQAGATVFVGATGSGGRL